MPELDARADRPARNLIFLRPATRLLEDRPYAVAIRSLSGLDGAPMEASPAFAALRDNTPTDNKEFEARQIDRIVNSVDTILRKPDKDIRTQVLTFSVLVPILVVAAFYWVVLFIL